MSKRACAQAKRPTQAICGTTDICPSVNTEISSGLGELTLAHSIESAVFVHDLQNPPAEDRSCDIDLTIVNSKGRITLAKQAVGLQTKYLLQVPDAESIGFTSFEQNDVEQEIKDLILASNLSLQRACLSTLGSELPRPEIQTEPAESPVKVEHTPQGVQITLSAAVGIGAYVQMRIGTKEELDEGRTLSNLGILRKLKRHKISTTPAIPAVTLSKALSEYENAMTVFPRLMIFKHLFNSLELSTNSDGTDRRGESLDKEVAKISGIAETDVGRWRDFYNRTKHVDKTPRDVTEFFAGLGSITETLMPLRRALTPIITERLGRIP